MRAPVKGGGQSGGGMGRIGMGRITGVWGAAFAAFVVVIVAFWALTAWHDRRLTIENAQRQVGATAWLMAAHAESAIGAADKVLLSVVADRSNQRPSAAYGPRLYLQLRQLLAGSPQLGAAWLLDAEGMLVADSLHAVPEPLNLADRSYFRAHRDHPAQDLLIETAELGAVTDRERFTMSRAVRGSGGEFRGVMVVGIFTDYFSDLYRDTDLADEVRSSLHLLDGTLVAAWPPMPERFDPSWMIELSGRIELGETEGGRIIRRDRSDYVIAWKRLTDIPAFVATAQPVAALLGDWRERAAFGGLLVLCAIGGFAVIAWRGWRGARAEAVAQRALRHAYDDLDRRIAERTAELAESEALAQRRLLELEALYAEAPVGLALYDRDLNLLRINEALARAIGLTVADSLRRPLGELMPDASRISAGYIRRVFETGEARAGVELRGRSHRVPETERIWIEDYYPVRDSAGDVVAVGVIYLDVSERVRAEDALRESDRRMQLAQEAGGMGLWDWDMKSGRTVRTDGFYHVWGLPPERFAANASFLDLVLPADRPRAAADVAAAIESGRPYHSEFRVPQPDGAIRWLEQRGEVRRDGAGQPVRMIGVCLDVTARKLVEERMKMLAAEVDHRSKNVLAIVQSMLQLTRADTVEEFRAAVHGRVAALGRAHGLLSESRWEGAELNRMVEDELAPYRGAGRVRIAGDQLLLPPSVAQALSVALHELATNAAKYGALSTAGGRVAIEWVLNDGWLRLIWQETGGPPVSPPKRRGFGSRVIERVVIAQLEGDVRFDWRSSGLLCAIAVPLHRPADGSAV